VNKGQIKRLVILL